jgi:hypothetical protein
LVLLCGSVLLGARVLSAADDTVAVWGARTSLTRGQEVTVDELAPVRVRFTDRATADRYVAAGDALPDGATLAQDLEPGELLPRAALDDGPDTALVEVPLAVEATGVPSSVTIGSHVDVWVTPASSSFGVGDTTAAAGSAGAGDGAGGPGAAHAGGPRAVRVLTDVAVVADGAAGSSQAGFGGGLLPVVVGVPPSAQDDHPDVLARLADGAVVLVRRQG